MKIRVQFIINDNELAVKFGRMCWIGKNENGEFTFSNIYTDERTANNDLTKEDLLKVHLMANKSGMFRIIEIKNYYNQY